jgi:hypothetical protein
MQKDSSSHIGQGDEGHDDEGPHKVSHGPGFEDQFIWLRGLGNNLPLLPAARRRKRAHVDGEDSEVPGIGSCVQCRERAKSYATGKFDRYPPSSISTCKRGGTRDMEGGSVKRSRQEGREEQMSNGGLGVLVALRHFSALS